MNQIQDQIIRDFAPLTEWFDKYEYLIKLGKSLKPMEKKYKTDEHQLMGCQSRVWIRMAEAGPLIVFQADSDALITRGLIALLLKVMNHQQSTDIVNNPLYFIDRIGLNSNLSPARANGLMSIVMRMKTLAAG
jgi:cysteine desulfuration protein SufE